jgi:ABC-2 type transport system ATP-binding protein
MNNKVIQLKNLKKTFKGFKKSEGLKASLRDFFNRQVVTTEAVKEISFDIEEGSIVGFLGPNGAGKTTTLKMLTGILTPTSGEATVLGHVPWNRKSEYKKQFSLVMGQKSQLWWDLPPMDSYELYKHMYEIPKKKFEKSLKQLTSLLDMKELIHVPTRKMSLGQRMKAELIGALLHQPKVLFLDEPTIGLDVVSQKAIRDFLKAYNKETNATILLTSHYMEDIRKLCNRVMIIDHGNIIYDGTYRKLIKKFAHDKLLDLTFDHEVSKKDIQEFGKIISCKNGRVKMSIPRENSSQVITKLMNKLPVEDISIHEKSMDDIVRDIFTNKNV